MSNERVGLWLHLGEGNSKAYEVECDCCQGGMYYEPATGSYLKCDYCHGTGHVRKRLTGAVDTFAFTPWEPTHTFYYCITHEGYPKTVERLIAAYRAGTLPDAVKAGLQEADPDA